MHILFLFLYNTTQVVHTFSDSGALGKVEHMGGLYSHHKINLESN